MVASAGVVAIALTGGFVLAAGDGGQDGSGDVVDQSERPVVGVADHVLMRGEAGGVSWTLAREEPKGGTGVCLRVRVRRGSGGMCMEDDPFDPDRSWRPRRGRVADEPLPLFVEVLSAQQASELGAVRAG